MSSPIWLTRDTMPGGGLAPIIDVWDIEPLRDTTKHSDGAVWMSRFDNVAGRVDILTIPECFKKYRVVPDTDLQMIRIGGRR